VNVLPEELGKGGVGGSTTPEGGARPGEKIEKSKKGKRWAQLEDIYEGGGQKGSELGDGAKQGTTRGRRRRKVGKNS